MTNLAQVKQRFTLAISVLAVICFALLVYLIWPGTSSSSMKAQEDTLQQQYRSLSREVAPLQGMDQKLVKTRADLKTLYQERIPTRFSQISQEVEKLTRETGVTAQNIHYNPEKPDKGDLQDVQRIEVDTTVTSDYAKVARFINALEQDKLLFVINQITLNGQEGGQVSLQIKFETFLKGAAQNSGT